MRIENHQSLEFLFQVIVGRPDVGVGARVVEGAAVEGALVVGADVVALLHRAGFVQVPAATAAFLGQEPQLVVCRSFAAACQAP